MGFCPKWSTFFFQRTPKVGGNGSCATQAFFAKKKGKNSTSLCFIFAKNPSEKRGDLIWGTCQFEVNCTRNYIVKKILKNIAFCFYCIRNYIHVRSKKSILRQDPFTKGSWSGFCCWFLLCISPIQFLNPPLSLSLIGHFWWEVFCRNWILFRWIKF